MMNSNKISFIIYLFSISCTMGFAQSTGIETGIQLYKAKKLPKAKEFFLQFHKDHPHEAPSCYYLGRIFLQEQEYKQAEKWFKKAIELDATNSNYHLWLARTYGIRAQKASIFKKLSLAKKSKKYFERAVKLDENNIEARVGLISFLLNAPGIAGGDRNKALEQAQILVKADEFRGRIMLAQIYEKKKEMRLEAV
ncbi:MAG: tetratricopeptide repeat protein [bacterium]